MALFHFTLYILLKGIVNLIKILSPFKHPHVGPNVYDIEVFKVNYMKTKITLPPITVTTRSISTSRFFSDNGFLLRIVVV